MILCAFMKQGVKVGHGSKIILCLKSVILYIYQPFYVGVWAGIISLLTAS